MSALLLAAVLLAAGCSRKEEPPKLEPKPDFMPAALASAYIALVEKPDATRVFLLGEEAKRLAPYYEHAGVRPSFALDGTFDIIIVSCGEMSAESCAKVSSHLTENGVMAWLMDMREVTGACFRRRVQSFAFETQHLWMPSEAGWVLVGRKTPRRIKLSAMLDLFAREQAFADLAQGHCETLPELFASYVGDRAGFLPAFAFLQLQDVVCPENFLTRDVPALDWVSAEGMDADIAKGVLSDMRSMQVVRRLVLEGNGRAVAAVDKKGEEAATDTWARAALRNPNDLFLLERIHRLERNAQGFLAVGKVLQAMKCYETVVLVRPNDPVAVHNFGMCLKRIGRNDLATNVLARAKKLEESLK